MSDPAELFHDMTGAILAGGKARRMGGETKGLLEVGGVAILDRVFERLRRCCSEILIVANEREPYESRTGSIYADVFPGRGSLGGLYTALKAATTEYVFVCACDMPFVHVDLIRHLYRRIGHYDAVIPRDAHGLQPMHGLYRRQILSGLEVRIGRDDLKIEHFIDSIGALVLGPAEVSGIDQLGVAFMNVNTPEDLLKANQWAALGGDPASLA
jgi:molybdopterin-guanine dinucleotide biosynthesis protein A